MRDPAISPVAGKVLSFYASAKLAQAITRHIKEDREKRRGEASAWFVEAAQRDLRARGVDDGSEAPSARERLVQNLLEAVAALTDEQLQAKLLELTEAVLVTAGEGSR